MPELDVSLRGEVSSPNRIRCTNDPRRHQTEIKGLIGNGLLKSLNPAKYMDEKFGIPTISDILKELEKSGRERAPNSPLRVLYLLAYGQRGALLLGFAAIEFIQ